MQPAEQAFGQLGNISHHQALTRASLDLGSENLRFDELGGGVAHYPTRNRPIAGDREFSPSHVNHSPYRPMPGSGLECQGIDRDGRNHRDPEGGSQALGCCQSDPDAGVETRPDIDDHSLEI